MINIIIPTYKARDTLADAFNSLCSQTKKMFWVTVVQDCDGEDYSDIIEEFKRRGLHISLLQRKENGGPGVARNDGILYSEKCNFEFLMFLDADDILFPQAVEHLGREIQANKADMIYSNFRCERNFGFDLKMEAGQLSSTWCHGRIYRTKYLIENNIFFRPDLRINEDSYFNLVVAMCTKKKGYIDEYTYLWRNNKNSITRSISNLDFFKKSSDQFMLSQIYALQKIKEITGSIPITCLAKTLYNIYSSHYCRAHFKLDNAIIEEKMKELGKIQEIIEAPKNPDFWNTVLESSKLGRDFPMKEGHYFVFYDWKITRWLNTYILGD